MSNGESTARQERFCEEFPVDLNATKAAVRAGYSEKTAYSIGHELLGKPKIRERIRLLTEKRSLRTYVTLDWVIEKLTEIVCAKTGVKTKEKIKALEVLAKHLRPFDKQSLECPELPDPDVKAKVSLEAISKEESQAFAIANLLSPLERHRVRKALEKWMEAQEHSKPTEAAESALEEDGNGEDEQDDSDIIELMKDVLGEERIKRSVQVSVESLLSRRQ